MRGRNGQIELRKKINYELRGLNEWHPRTIVTN